MLQIAVMQIAMAEGYRYVRFGKRARFDCFDILDFLGGKDQ
jgi:hypothetical protein